jgi:hypothetical protein
MAAWDLILHDWQWPPREGDAVLVLPERRNKDRRAFDRALPGRVLAEADGGACRVAHDGGGEALVPRRKLVRAYRRMHSERALVVATFDTTSFRRLMRLYTTADDAVLEVGCSYGACSALLAGEVAAYVGVDNSFECVEHCRGLALPRARFERVDALAEPGALAALFADVAPTVVVIDIGGVRGLPDVLEMVEVAIGASVRVEATRPPLLLLKSEALVTAARAHLAALSLPHSSPIGCPDGWWARTREQCHACDGGLKHAKRAGLAPQIRKANWYPQRAVALGAPCICRFHNYGRHGCAKGRSGDCPFDHIHCHFCLAPGHVARECPAFLATLADDAGAAHGPPPNAAPRSDSEVDELQRQSSASRAVLVAGALLLAGLLTRLAARAHQSRMQSHGS